MIGRPAAAYVRGRDNNFTLARFVAASLVIFTHAFGVTGHGGSEPFRQAFGVSAGTWAVDVFFVMSGFLVTKSYDSRKALLPFAYARFMRIYPAMWVCVEVCVLLVGPMFTTLPWGDYARHVDTWKFVVANATLLPFGAITGLPAVFEGHPVAGVNISLWTLPYELRMYVATALLGLTGLLGRRWVVAAVFAACASAHFGLFGQLGASWEAYARLSYYFSAGAAAYAWRDHVPLAHAVALGLFAALGLSLAVPSVAVREVALTVATPYLVLWFCLVPGGPIRRFNRLGDYSYGVYVYAFPVQQALVHFFPSWGVLLNATLSMFGTLALAVPSWHFVEKPALDCKLPAWVAGSRRPAHAAPPQGDLLQPATASDREAGA